MAGVSKFKMLSQSCAYNLRKRGSSSFGNISFCEKGANCLLVDGAYSVEAVVKQDDFEVIAARLHQNVARVGISMHESMPKSGN
jgi:hypothetical protein